MSIYNEDELVPPAWIDQDFLEKVLQKYENNKNIQLTQWAITPASMKGDHYASIMFRCKISYNCPHYSNVKQKSLILKTLPTEDGPKRDMLKESNLFETEIRMYTEALPKIEKILCDYGEDTKLSAEIIYHSLEPYKILIIEDLCESGYETIRGRYLNEDELKMVYRKIAKLHAASFVLGQADEHEGSSITNFEDGLFCSSAIMEMGFMSEGIINFLKMLSNDEQLKIYFDKIKLMEPDMIARSKMLYEAFKIKNNSKDIFVLNHGDFHMKNMMFKFNANHEMEDVIMVDYQLSCYAPSNIDLMYSQYLIMKAEFRLRRNEFMFYYFEEFTRLIRILNFQGKLPQYSDFQMATLKYRHFALFLLSTFLPHVPMVLVASANDLKDMDTTKYVEEAELGALAYQSQEFIEEMRRFLPILLFDGYFD